MAAILFLPFENRTFLPGFQMVLTKWLPIMAAILFLASENQTQKVSEKRSLENRTVRFLDGDCLSIFFFK
jgi:hypothetical protein